MCWLELQSYDGLTGAGGRAFPRWPLHGPGSLVGVPIVASASPLVGFSTGCSRFLRVHAQRPGQDLPRCQVLGSYIITAAVFHGSQAAGPEAE